MISRPFILGVEKSMKWLRNILANIKGVMVFFNSLEEYRYLGGWWKLGGERVRGRRAHAFNEAILKP
jgi:hypothetical protein